MTTALEIRRVLQVRDMEAALVLQVPWAEDLLHAELDRRRDELRRRSRIDRALGSVIGIGMRPYYLRRAPAHLRT